MYWDIERVLGQRRASDMVWTDRLMQRPAASGARQVVLTFEDEADVTEAWMLARKWYRAMTPEELASDTHVQAVASALASGQEPRDWRHYMVRFFNPQPQDVRLAEEYADQRRRDRVGAGQR